jgi:DNA-binding transcriptional regulator YhcF (GntR family)
MTSPLADLDVRVERGGEIPVGAQLAGRLRAAIGDGSLAAGSRLPSIRELAAAARVNVNTVRSVYARLEHEGLVKTEHGRGSFVSEQPGAAPSEATTRRRLRREIAALEAELSRRPRLAATLLPPPPERTGGARALPTEELAAVRDDLLERLRELDTARAEVIHRLEELERAEELELSEEAGPEQRRRSSTSLAGARVRWVGGV